MEVRIEHITHLLQRTPAVLEALLLDLPEAFVHATEGESTWSPFDVLGHLVHTEKTDWLARVNICLAPEGNNKTFAPVDRFAQLESSKGNDLAQLLHEFKEARATSITALKAANITPAQLQNKAIHPQLGEVTLSQLLATWVSHDQDHLYQISRVIARQYDMEVGPWKANLRIIKQQLV